MERIDGRYAGYFLLRRLHSLTGIIPVGIFLLQHLFVNSFVLRGGTAYNDVANFLRGLPYVTWIEFAFILGPLTFHGLIGLTLIYGGGANVGAYRYYRNWMYLLQRITGALAAIFITYHVITAHFSGAEDLYQLMTVQLNRPAIFWFYVVGVVAACYHLCNGLFGFCITWGLATGARSQAVLSVVSSVAFLVVAFWGVNILLAFMGQPIVVSQ